MELFGWDECSNLDGKKLISAQFLIMVLIMTERKMENNIHFLKDNITFVSHKTNLWRARKQKHKLLKHPLTSNEALGWEYKLLL